MKTELPETVSGPALAALFGVSDRHIRNLADAGILRKAARGEYPLAENITTYIQHKIGTSPGTDLDGMSPRSRNDFYASELKRIELETRCKELIPAADVEREMRSLFATFTGFLQTLPDILERDAGISGAAAERVQIAIDEARDRLYEAMGNHSTT